MCFHFGVSVFRKKLLFVGKMFGGIVNPFVQGFNDGSTGGVLMETAGEFEMMRTSSRCSLSRDGMPIDKESFQRSRTRLTLFVV